jgi:hypothetical protein
MEPDQDTDIDLVFVFKIVLWYVVALLAIILLVAH